jgi:DNA-binding Xre family transcriptional regulator
MARITLEQLGPMLKKQRGSVGVRAAAKEIGISAATLSRVESGKQPDLATFAKICDWLEIDPGEVLGCSAARGSTDRAAACSAQFRAERTMSPETARHLTEMILRVQESMQNEG